MADDKKVPEKTTENVNKTKTVDTPEKVTYKTPDKEYTINIVRDYHGFVDPFYLTQKDPNYAYRFLRDDPKNINIKTGNLLFAKGGWQICPKTHLERIGMKDRDISPDGLCRRGDQILAFMPKELYAEKEEYKRKQAEAPMKAVKRLLKEGDPALAGLGHKDMKGLQTKEQLGMK